MLGERHLMQDDIVGLDEARARPTAGSGNRIAIVGTAHVSEKSVAEVTRAIEEMRPDIVAVELCPARYKALTGQEDSEEIKISELLKGGKIYTLLVQWLLAYIQKRIGAEMGVKPGAEMLAAIETSRRLGLRVALVDRDIGITIQRFWSSMGIVEKLKLAFGLIPAAFGWGDDEIEIERVTEEDVVSQIIAEFRKISPKAAGVLVDERDAYIARNLIGLSTQGSVLAVVGAGHREGIMRHLAHPDEIPEIEALKEKKKSRITAARVFGALVTLLIFGTIGLVLMSGVSHQSLILAFAIWFFVNGILAALGVIIARGHPLSALTAFMVAWLTSLNPMVAAGWFAGMVEAWKRTPTVADMKRLAQCETFNDMMGNRLFRVILVAALANIGSTIGTFLGIYIIWSKLGLMDPTQMLSGIL